MHTWIRSDLYRDNYVLELQTSPTDHVSGDVLQWHNLQLNLININGSKSICLGMFYIDDLINEAIRNNLYQIPLPINFDSVLLSNSVGMFKQLLKTLAEDIFNNIEIIEDFDFSVFSAFVFIELDGIKKTMYISDVPYFFEKYISTYQEFEKWQC